MGTEARIRIGLDGAEQTAVGLQRVKGAMAGVASGMGAVATDALRVATAIKTINLSEAASAARQYEESLSRMSGRAGQGIDQLKERFGGLSREILVSQSAQAEFARSLGRITYDTKASVDSLKSLGTVALATGQTLEEQFDFGRTLQNSLGVVGNFDQALGKIRAQAEQAGIDWVKFKQAITDSSGALEQVGRQSDGTKDKMVALAATLGKGFGKDGIQRVTSSAVSTLQGRALDVERMLGHRILDDQGHVKDPLGTWQEVKSRTEKRLGKGTEATRRALISSAGPELGSALFVNDIEKTKAILGADADAAAAKTNAEADQFRATKGGQALARQTAQKDAELGAGGILTSAQNAVSGALGNNPWALMAAGYLGPAAGRGLLGGIKGLFGGSAAAGAGGAAAGGAAAGAGAAGLAGSQAALAAEGGAALKGLVDAGLFGGTLTAGTGGALALAGGALAGVAGFQGLATNSLSKDSGFARGRRENLAAVAGKEAGQEAIRKGEMDMDIIRKARSVEGGEKEMIAYLAKLVDRLPPDLASQIGRAIAEEQRKNAPLLPQPATTKVEAKP